MKKYTTTIFCIFLALHSYSQDSIAKTKSTWWTKLTTPPEERERSRKVEANILPVDSTTNKVTYTGIVDAPGVTKRSLFDKSKKWIGTKNSPNNPYSISYESAEEGSVIAKGAFTLPAERKKYLVQFVLKISTKANKFKYEVSDLIIQYHAAAGTSGGGFSYWSSSSYKEAETLEYTLETFYPARLNGRKPAIKFYEEIDMDSFEAINREMLSITSSLKQSMSKKDDW